MQDSSPRTLGIVGNLLSVLLLLLVLGAAGYYFYQARPCAAPITYRIDTVDSKFGISIDTVKADAARGAALWNAAAGKTVLEYSDTGTVPIRLIYDVRQENAQTSKTIDAQEASDAQARAVLDEATQAYKTNEAAYRAKVSAFNAEADTYQANVRAANARGGASGQEYAGLKAEEATLKTEQLDLNAQTSNINARAAALKAQTDAFNERVRTTNAAASAYNANASGDFNEGEYVKDDMGTRISIYEFTNNTQLMRVLAHELGHAIGLGHNQNPDSIMYPYNTSSSAVLSADDKAALTARCTFSASTIKSLLLHGS